MLLDIVSGTNLQPGKEEAIKRKKTKHLIHRSKLLLLRNKPCFEFSLVDFIEDEMGKLKGEKGDKPYASLLHHQNYDQLAPKDGYDVREESLADIHRLMRGEAKSD